MKRDVLSWLSKARIVVSMMAYAIAIAFLAVSVFIFAWMWIQALAIGAVPEADWGTITGNHGPWRHLYELRSMWWGILNLQFWSVYLAMLSLVTKPSKKAATTLLAAF